MLLFEDPFSRYQVHTVDSTEPRSDGPSEARGIWVRLREPEEVKLPHWAPHKELSTLLEDVAERLKMVNMQWTALIVATTEVFARAGSSDSGCPYRVRDRAPKTLRWAGRAVPVNKAQEYSYRGREYLDFTIDFPGKTIYYGVPGVVDNGPKAKSKPQKKKKAAAPKPVSEDEYEDEDDAEEAKFELAFKESIQALVGSKGDGWVTLTQAPRTSVVASDLRVFGVHANACFSATERISFTGDVAGTVRVQLLGPHAGVRKGVVLQAKAPVHVNTWMGSNFFDPHVRAGHVYGRRPSLSPEDLKVWVFGAHESFTVDEVPNVTLAGTFGFVKLETSGLNPLVIPKLSVEGVVGRLWVEGERSYGSDPKKPATLWEVETASDSAKKFFGEDRWGRGQSLNRRDFVIPTPPIIGDIAFDNAAVSLGGGFVHPVQPLDYALAHVFASALNSHPFPRLEASASDGLFEADQGVVYFQGRLFAGFNAKGRFLICKKLLPKVLKALKDKNLNLALKTLTSDESPAQSALTDDIGSILLEQLQASLT